MSDLIKVTSPADTKWRSERMSQKHVFSGVDMCLLGGTRRHFQHILLFVSCILHLKHDHRKKKGVAFPLMCVVATVLWGFFFLVVVILPCRTFVCKLCEL